jgi:4-amino-4-deoxy-L-arabinose transferase-like glycosyltransferase
VTNAHPAGTAARRSASPSDPAPRSESPAPDPRGALSGLLDSTSGFVILLLGYLVVHLVLRVALSGVVTIDDAREAVLGQTFAWGYQARQPPLYNWLVRAAFRLFGVSVLSLTLVKYAVLGVAYGFVYASARRLLPTPRLAALATASLLLVIPVSWTFHEALTHSVAVLAACTATFYVLLRLRESGDARVYLALGLVAGLGLLSKYTYAVFVTALLLAALTDPSYRRRLRHPFILLTLGLAALLVVPSLAWFWRHGGDLSDQYAREVRSGQDAYLTGVMAGLYYTAKIGVYYLGILALVFTLLFPAWVRRLPAPRDPDGPAEAGGRLLGRFLLSVALLLVAGAFSSQLAFLKFRWMIPALCLAPLYAAWRVARAGVAPDRLRWLGRLLAIVAVGIVLAFVVAVVGAGRVGRPAHLAAPYDRLADGLARTGFSDGTIVVGPGSLAGSLRFRFPRARILTLEQPQYVPPREGKGQCLVVWERGDPARVPENVERFLKTVLDARAPQAAPIRAVEAPYHYTVGHRRQIGYIFIPDGLGACR